MPVIEIESLSLDGSASVSVGATALYSVASGMAGSAEVNPVSETVWEAIATWVGVSGLSVDPTGVSVTNYSQGHQIPVIERVVVVPTVRVTAPTPPSPSYMMAGQKSPRRRDG